jgi:glycosyltransferase-like protein
MPEPLRIALLTHSVNPRGGVVHTLELARALHERGHEVTVLAPAQPGQQFFRDVPHAVSLVPVGPPPAGMADMVGNRIEACTRHLAGLLRQQHFDVLHAHDGIGGNALATLAEAGAIPGFVRTVHHLDPFDDPRLAAWQQRAVLAARQLLCVSETWRRVLREDYGREAALVNNGVDLQRYTRQPDAQDAALVQQLGLRLDAPRCLSVGGVEARKNSVRILRAFLQLRARAPRAQLIVAGGASLLDHSACAAEFQAVVAEAGIGVGPGQDLVLTGPLPDAQMPALFRQASVLAMPSLREGFGLVVLEALACGTPVVVSGQPPFTEYLRETADAGHALFVDPLDSTAIATALQHAAEPARRAALAVAVPPVCHRYGWRASAARHEVLYRAQHALERTIHARHALPPALA